MTDVETYKKLLNKNNKFLAEAQVITLYGLTRTAADYQMPFRKNKESPEEVKSVRSILESSASITAMYPTTQTETTGKWFVLTDKLRLEAAQAMIDNRLKAIFDYLPDIQGLRVEDQPHPKRANAVKSSENILSYANVLKSRVSNDEAIQTFTKAPPQKRAVQCSFSEEAYNSLQNKKQRSDSPKSNTSTVTETTVGTAASTMKQLIQAEMNSFRGEFQTFIKAEITAQLTEVMKEAVGGIVKSINAALKEEMSNIISAALADPAGAAAAGLNIYPKDDIDLSQESEASTMVTSDSTTIDKRQTPSSPSSDDDGFVTHTKRNKKKVNNKDPGDPVSPPRRK